MRVVELPEILAALDEENAIAAIEEGFRRLHADKVQIAAVGHLRFTDPPGDCHIKSGYAEGSDVYVVKVAASFYRNPQHGLSSSSGFMAVLSARTGELLALLNDGGVLTDTRTAMAGAIAARLIARPDSKTLGIVGAGIQARMQASLIARRLGFETVLVWARDPRKAEAFAADLCAEAVPLQELCSRADLIVTTTPSTEPILTVDHIQPGCRIIAVGADTPGKQELETALTGKARIVVDSREQCIEHGEAGWAVRAGLIDTAALIELGALITEPRSFAASEIVVADLTGVAIQDAAIAASVWTRLARH